MTQTRLDAALARLATGDDAAWLGFYAAFAVQPITLILVDNSATVVPRLLVLDQGPTALGFDGEDRLAAFVTRPTERAVLTGAALARALAGQGVWLALNPGTEGAETVLDPDQLAWIATHFGAEVAQGGAPGARLRSPRAPEAALLGALGQRLAELGAVVGEAWLAALHREGADELVLVLRPTLDAPEIAGDVARDLTRIGQMATAQPFAVALVVSGSAELEGARRVGIGLTP